MMSRIGGWIVTALVVLNPLAAQTVDEIAARNLAARGGEERIRAVRSMRFVGRISGVHGGEAGLVFEWRRPEAVRITTTIQGMDMIQASDGESGWLVMPFYGSTDAQPASAQDLARLARSADVDGPFVDPQAKGRRIELLGRDRFEGSEVFRLRVTESDGTAVELDLDAETYLVLRETGTRVQGGVERRYESVYGDFKEVDGLLVPFSRELRVEGAPTVQVTTLDSVELDVALPDGRFAMPAKTGSGG